MRIDLAAFTSLVRDTFSKTGYLTHEVAKLQHRETHSDIDDAAYHYEVI